MGGLSMRSGWWVAIAVALLAGAGCGGGGDDGGVVAVEEEPETTTTSAPDDRRLVAYLLPDAATFGAGWVRLNQEPDGPDDPTLPTGPELSGDCGGQRAVDEKAASFVLYERRRLSDLDEMLVSYGLLFDNDDHAGAQVALYRSATFEGCVLDGMRSYYGDFGLDVQGAWEDRPLPAIAVGVDATGRRLRSSIDVDGSVFESTIDVTVLRSGRGVSLLIREAFFGAPEPFHVDGVVEDLAERLTRVVPAASPG